MLLGLLALFSGIVGFFYYHLTHRWAYRPSKARYAQESQNNKSPSDNLDLRETLFAFFSAAIDNNSRCRRRFQGEFGLLHVSSLWAWRPQTTLLPLSFKQRAGAKWPVRFSSISGANVSTGMRPTTTFGIHNKNDFTFCGFSIIW